MADSRAGRRRPRGRRAAPQRRPARRPSRAADAWVGRAGLRAAADVNAVPPLGVEGIEVTDDGVERDGVTAFGALGVGGLKMKIHKACIARLFEHNDLVLDAETIAEVAREIAPPRAGARPRMLRARAWSLSRWFTYATH